MEEKKVNEEVIKKEETEAVTDNKPDVKENGEKPADKKEVEVVQPEKVEETVTDKTAPTKNTAVKEDVVPAPEAKVEETTKAEESSTEENKNDINDDDRLSVIKEVRKELAELYSQNKDAITKNDGLNKENTDLKTRVDNLSKRVELFETSEQKRKEEFRKNRIVVLSDKFKDLGREKSAEDLSKYSDDLLDEFEQTVDVALKTKSANSVEKVSVSSAKAAAPVSIPKTKETVAAPVQRNLNRDDFFEAACKVMSKQSQQNTKIRI